MMPSSDQIASDSRPYSSRIRAESASPHAACTRPPNGESTHTRQSPISSRKRSTTIVRSLGMTRVASCCSRRNSTQVAGGLRVQVVALDQRRRVLIDGPAGEGADRLAELARAAQAVALPERDRARDAGRGRDDHAVARDLLDPPRGRAEQEHLARAGLVDHLLVELADAAAVREVDAEQAAVGDRARVGDRQRARALARPDRARSRGPRRCAGAARRTPRSGSARRACRARSRAASATAPRTCRCGPASPRAGRRAAASPRRRRPSRRSAGPARRAGSSGRRSSRSCPRACAGRRPRTRAGRRGTSGRSGPWRCRRRCGRRGRCAAGRR